MMSDIVTALTQRYFKVADGELFVGGIPIGQIVAEYGTPLFIYDRDILDCKWALLRRTLPPGFDIYYSVKANPNLSILKFFLDKGCGLEIASGGEFYLAIRAGCPPGKILFAGPGKTEAELELVLSQGIGQIHVESALEVQRIGEISRRLGSQARVAVRVNPDKEVQGGAMRMGGKPTPFGVDEEILDSILDLIISDSSILFEGIHLFTGTQILDAKILLGQYKKGIEIGRHAAERTKKPLHTLDFGGGLGIPYFPNERDLDMETLRSGLHVLISDARREDLLSDTRYVIEPGRYLVGEAGIYVIQITDVKVSRGKKFFIVDGGMNHHLAASGNLGQVIKRNFPVAVLNRLQETLGETVDIVGSLCTPLDVLSRGFSAPRAEVGDLVGVFQSGAYARTASPLGFLSHKTPAEVLVEEGKVRLIRRRGTEGDLLNDTP